MIFAKSSPDSGWLIIFIRREGEGITFKYPFFLNWATGNWASNFKVSNTKKHQAKKKQKKYGFYYVLTTLETIRPIWKLKQQIFEHSCRLIRSCHQPSWQPDHVAYSSNAETAPDI